MKLLDYIKTFDYRYRLLLNLLEGKNGEDPVSLYKILNSEAFRVFIKDIVENDEVALLEYQQLIQQLIIPIFARMLPSSVSMIMSEKVLSGYIFIEYKHQIIGCVDLDKEMFYFYSLKDEAKLVSQINKAKTKIDAYQKLKQNLLNEFDHQNIFDRKNKKKQKKLFEQLSEIDERIRKCNEKSAEYGQRIVDERKRSSDIRQMQQQVSDYLYTALGFDNEMKNVEVHPFEQEETNSNGLWDLED